MTVSGYVRSGGVPLFGAHVRVDELGIDRTTDSEGRYSFVVSANSVRGQAVKVIATMADRRLKYVPMSVSLTLTGEPLTQDFDLPLATGIETAVAAKDSIPSPEAKPALPATVVTSDAIAPDDATGTGGLASVLVGRVAGLQVSPASVPGGSSQFVFRGQRSALGGSQPLFVVDGLPMSNTAFTSSAQRFGFGGFDYGTSIDDIDLANIESVRFISGADAAALYGGRGANGVVLVTTKSGLGGPHFAIGATQVAANGSYLRLPELQNSYGQGLDGKFAFFDGKGGGINDAIGENWGPALDGRPAAQASYTEAGRADVRFWLRNPDNMAKYFSDGGFSKTTATIRARSDVVAIRAFVANQNQSGITPRDRLGQRDAALHLSIRPSSRFELSVSAMGTETKNENSPVTGAIDGSPVFQFLRMGRQVDMDSLERHLRDAAGRQISWNYTSYNNPFFESLAGDNYSRRFHTAGAGDLTYALTSTLTARVRGGFDSYRDGRLFAIPAGWMGGFPYFAGPGNFSRGGSQGDEISIRQNNIGARLDNQRTLGSNLRWTLSGGVDLQATDQTIRSAGVDSIANVPSAGAPATATIPQPATWSASANNNSVFGEAGFGFQNGASIRASVRNAWISMAPSQTATVLLPSVRGSIDLGRSLFAGSHAVSAATLRGAWWMDAPETNPYLLQTLYAGRAPTGGVAPVGAAGLAASASLSPEVTNGFEVGTDLTFRRFGLRFGASYYHEQTSDVILPMGDGSSVVAMNIGSITNQGIEGRLNADFGDGEDGLGWQVSANASKNSNRVNRLSGGQTAVPLGPSTFGVTIDARPGAPLGVIRGYRLQRNSSGALILRNGVPAADSAAGLQRLGVAQPSFSFGVGNTLRYRWISVSAQIDGRIGGQVFSATNMVGTYAGTLASTAFRPDTGLLILGVDATSGQANTQHVSAQDYYHALGSVAEPWVYSATFVKLRDARVSATLPLHLASLPFESIRASVVGRNLGLWAKAPNIDPDAVFSTYQLRGLEMGQLPMTKSIGFEITVIP